MAKGTEKDSGDKPSYWRELFSARLYKRSQGRITRQVTFAVIAFAFGLGAWQWFNTLLASSTLTNTLNSAARQMAPVTVEEISWKVLSSESPTEVEQAAAAEELEAARTQYAALRAQGYRAYVSKGGARVTEFPEISGSLYLEREPEAPRWIRYAVALGLPLLMLAVGCWAAFRLVSYPPFADFLIAVEAEMNKVSWPSRGELIRSSIVVIVVIFSLAILLFSYDLFWKFLLGKDVLGIVFS